MSPKKVLVGMSGGVDSSVTAALLIEQGYDVSGVFVEAYNEPGCRTDQDKKDALQVALKLKIPFEVLDLRKQYKEKVVKYFFDEYRAGRTPNPDVVCNREVKFGILYDWARERGYDYLATGHYARIAIDDRGQHWLQQPRDKAKDQTYFLWQVARDKLEHILWPLGELEKSEVRSIAHKLDLPNANKPDSMGVCMIGEVNVHDFLQDKLGSKSGEVYWHEKRVGTHDGVWFYTIGARGGWKVDPDAQSEAMPPLYVIGKDVVNNRLRVGQREEAHLSQFSVESYGGEFEKNNLFVRIRNLGELIKVLDITNNVVRIERPVFAPAAGQSAVFYDEVGRVRGGGVIAN